MQRDFLLQRRQLDVDGAEQRVAAEPAAATEHALSTAAAPATHATRYTLATDYCTHMRHATWILNERLLKPTLLIINIVNGYGLLVSYAGQEMPHRF